MEYSIGTIQTSKLLVQKITAEQAWHYRIIPFREEINELHFYIDEQQNENEVKEELEFLLAQQIRLTKVESSIIQQSLSTFYLRNTNSVKAVQHLNPNSDQFLGHLIAEAKNLNSSDIHIEAYEERCRIRVRIDGLMVERHRLTKNEYPALINKIKILSNLDIAEKRLPQDGRIFYTGEGHKFDIRVSILPTLYGEKIVLRILSNDATHIDIHHLGFSDFDLSNYLEGVKRPNGIVLISGPTGSGKTTTLYATLKLLNKETRNILTIEDPIEYTLEGINQVQLKESIGLNFSAALRTFLRQDPDVIMVGEIRDVETATMAIRASLTGHLVLSTIHTNSAWGTISRLIDMGVPAFLIASTLNTTVAQRLIRLLCTSCRKKEAFDQSLFPKQFKSYKPILEHYVPRGCEHCFYTGYKGRKAVYEIIPIDEELLIHIKNNKFEINEELKQRNIKTLGENAFELFERGDTSLEEIYSLLYNY